MKEKSSLVEEKRPIEEVHGPITQSIHVKQYIHGLRQKDKTPLVKANFALREADTPPAEAETPLEEGKTPSAEGHGPTDKLNLFLFNIHGCIQWRFRPPEKPDPDAVTSERSYGANGGLADGFASSAQRSGMNAQCLGVVEAGGNIPSPGDL